MDTDQAAPHGGHGVDSPEGGASDGDGFEGRLDRRFRLPSDRWVGLVTTRTICIDWDYGLIVEWGEEGRWTKGPRLREAIRIDIVAAIYEWGSNMSACYRNADEDPDGSMAPEQADRLTVEFEHIRQSLAREGIVMDPPYSRWLENRGTRDPAAQI